MSVRLILALGCLLSLLLGSADPAHAKSDKAQGGGKPAAAGKAGDSGKGKNDGSDAAAAAAAAGVVLAGVLLSDQDRRTILQYFDQHPQPVTSLPPGIAKNLARGKPLPPGIAKRGLPNALTGQLRIPSGYELQTVGADVVLIEIGTRIIADILKDAVRK